MKILVKGKQVNKVFKDQITFKEIAQFINNKFEEKNIWNLVFKDSENDNIMISSENDLEVVRVLSDNKNFIILNLNSDSDTNEKPMKQKKQRSPKDKVKRERHYKKTQEQIEKKQKSPRLYQGKACNQCKLLPIVGIRYLCLDCQDYNICQDCEVKSEHPHNLMKIKKPNHANSLKRKHRQFKRQQRQLFREMIKKNVNTSSSGESTEKKQRNSQEKRIQRRLKKLTNLFQGKQEDYLDFVNLTIEEKMPNVIAKYAEDNKIDLNEKMKKSFEKKLLKLAFFFDKVADTYTSFVEENPTLNFHQLIKLMKQNGIEQYNGENFARMRQKMRQLKGQKRTPKQKHCHQQRKQRQKNKISPKKEQTINQIVQQASKKQGPNQFKIKGKILLEMKDLFGNNRSKQYFKFIEDNFSQGRNKIIELWLEKQSKE